MQPGGHDAQGHGQLLTDARPSRLGPAGQLLHRELVEGDGVGDLGRDQVVLEQESPLPLFAQRERPDRGDANRGELLGALPLVASLAATEPLAEDRPAVRDQEVLDIKRALGELDVVDDPVWTGLDGRRASRRPPFVQPEPVGAQEDVAPGRAGAHPPADLAEPGPFPVRRLEHPGQGDVGRRAGIAARRQGRRDCGPFLWRADAHRWPIGLRLEGVLALAAWGSKPGRFPDAGACRSTFHPAPVAAVWRAPPVIEWTKVSDQAESE